MAGPSIGNPARLGLLVLIALLLARVWLAIDLPLTDTTEARYGEIARKMVETADWITPQHDYGVPFWGKPPLAFWLAALGIEALGPTDLAPRLMILLVSVGFLGGLFVWLRREIGANAAAVAVAIQASSLLYFVSMAAVMTDMVLTACVGTALMAFWSRYRGAGARSELVLYVALGLGLLAKGPLAAVLVLGPIGLWSLATGSVAAVWRRFAWIRGALLTAAVALPWYLVAEMKTPGFLHYFIVGEHFGRFFVPNWQGDLYGDAHQEPAGMIWAFFFAGMLPWSVLLLPLPVTRRSVLASSWPVRRDLIVFGLAWALVPLLLFTPSANIISPYVLPAVPGATIAFVAAYVKPDGRERGLAALFCLSAAIVIGLSLWLDAKMHMDTAFASDHTQKPVIESIRRTYGAGCRVYYWKRRWFSAEYYSAGQARQIDDAAALGPALGPALDGTATSCLVLRDADLAELPETIEDRARSSLSVGDFAVLELAPVPPAAAPIARPR